jgi:hypothetical protein
MHIGYIARSRQLRAAENVMHAVIFMLLHDSYDERNDTKTGFPVVQPLHTVLSTVGPFVPCEIDRRPAPCFSLSHAADCIKKQKLVWKIPLGSP